MAWIANATNAGSHVLLKLAKCWILCLGPHLEISDEMKTRDLLWVLLVKLQIETAPASRLKTSDMAMKVYWARKNLGIFFV